MKAAIFAFIACLCVTEAGAQVVQGRFFDESGRPVIAGLVMIADGTGAPVASTLTDSTGAYRLQANSPGLYRLRIERIGYEAVNGAVTLQSGVTSMTDRLPARAIDFSNLRPGRSCAAAMTAWSQAYGRS